MYHGTCAVTATRGALAPERFLSHFNQFFNTPPPWNCF
jgi:hypothetical protein